MHLWRQAFERHLRESLGDGLQLTWTRNRRVMISYRRSRGTPVLRLHESFASAGPGIRDDLVYFIRHGRKVPDSVRDFVRRISSDIAAQRETIRPKGKYYDLQRIYRKLNEEYFGGMLKGRITWGKRSFSGKKRSIVFGSYLSGPRLIRLHPVLDTEIVPRFYVESVVHHEMVHEFLDFSAKPEQRRGRAHSAQFRNLERKFRFYELAAAWEKSHLPKLLRYRPFRRES